MCTFQKVGRLQQPMKRMPPRSGGARPTVS
jgi:hypothetical protein